MGYKIQLKCAKELMRDENFSLAPPTSKILIPADLVLPHVWANHPTAWFYPTHSLEKGMASCLPFSNPSRVLNSEWTSHQN